MLQLYQSELGGPPNNPEAFFQDAKRARAAMTDKEFHGRRIRVDFSISKGPHQRTPGKQRVDTQYQKMMEGVSSLPLFSAKLGRSMRWEQKIAFCGAKL